MKRKIIILILIVVTAVSMALLVACNNDEGKYTVTFEVNGGSEVKQLKLFPGDEIPIPKNPTKEHFTFEYWCGDKALTTRYTFGVMPAQNIVLYAKWTPQQAVRITFESNGGSAVADMVVASGGAISAPQEPTREGYSFAGWYKDEGLTEYFAFNNAPTENITLYARWIIKQGNVLVNYVVNGATVDTLSVPSGTKIAPLELGENLVATWYADNNYSSEFDFSTAISANTTVYAVAYTKGLTFNGGAVTGYNGNSSKVVIPSRYNGTAITAVAERAFYKNTDITEVELPTSIQSIGDYAFYDCSYLNNINLTNNVKTLGQYAFYNNVRLEQFGEITGITEIKEGVFLGCVKLDTFVFSENIQKIGKYAFADCTSIQNLTLPNTVTSIGDYAFAGCSQLGSFIIPRSLTTLGAGVFEDCVNLTQMTVAQGNTKFSIVDRNLYTDMNRTLVMYLQADKTDTSYITRNETKILEGAFASYNLLKSITIGQNVTTIEMGALRNAKRLEELVVPYLGDGADNLYLSYVFGAPSAQDNGMTGAYVPSSLRKVTITNPLDAVPAYAFYGCIGLEEIVGLENATTYGSYAFSYTAIKTFEIPSAVTSIGQNSSGVSAFTACYSLEEVTVASGNSVYASYDGSIYDKTFTTLYYVPSAKTQINFSEQVTIISGYAFASSNITEIEVPNSVVEIGFRAFYNANKLSYLKLPFIGGSSTEENRYMLYLFGGTIQTNNGTTTVENSDLVPLSLERIDYYGIDNIPNFAFYACRGLKTVNYGDEITAIGDYAFALTALTEVAIGGGVTTLGNFCFYNIDSLTGEVVVPARITSMGSGCFGYNRNITTVTIEEGVTEIGYGAFISYSETQISAGASVTYYYSSLTEINIPASVTTIGALAFDGAGRTYSSTYGTHVLYSVTVNIAEGSKLKEVGYGAFAESGIQEITLPATLEYLGEKEDESEESEDGSVFLSCSALKSVTIGNAEEGSNLKHIGSITFAYCTQLTTLTIYKNVASDSEVPTLRTAPLSSGARVHIFYNGAVPTINVFGADIYKDNTDWMSFAKNIYEIQV